MVVPEPLSRTRSMITGLDGVAGALAALAAAGVAGAAGGAWAGPGRRYLRNGQVTADPASPDPLRRALRYGFAAVELPVLLGGDGDLVVAADPALAEPHRTVSRLVLAPLAARAGRYPGRVHPAQAGTFTVLLRLVEPDAGAGPYPDPGYGTRAYRSLRRCLGATGPLLTRYRDGQVSAGPVTVLLTGGQWPRAELAAQADRYVFGDGTLADLGRLDAPPDLVPMVTEDWSWRFGWDGTERMPAEERYLLHALVRAVHEDGRRVRVVGGPHRAGPARRAYWRELVAAGVDLVGGTDPGALRRVLRRPATRSGARAAGPDRRSQYAAIPDQG